MWEHLHPWDRWSPCVQQSVLPGLCGRPWPVQSRGLHRSASCDQLFPNAVVLPVGQAAPVRFATVGPPSAHHPYPNHPTAPPSRRHPLMVQVIPGAAVGSAQAVHTQAQQSSSGWWRIGALAGTGAAGLALVSSIALADEAEHGLEAPDYPWSHNGFFSSYDHKSIRRGFQVRWRRRAAPARKSDAWQESRSGS